MNEAGEGLLAALPILIILVAMLGFRWSAAKAGAAGLAASFLLAWFVVDPVFSPAGGLGTGLAIITAGALAEAVFTAFTILWVIFPAVNGSCHGCRR